MHVLAGMGLQQSQGNLVFRGRERAQKCYWLKSCLYAFNVYTLSIKAYIFGPGTGPPIAANLLLGGDAL